MDPGPLVTEQIDAGARFLAGFQGYAPVRVAFWLKEDDAAEWDLYVASDRITDDNFDVAYGEVLRLAGQIHDPWFDPFRVKLVGTDDPLARAAADLQRRHAGRIPPRFHGQAFNGVTGEDVYVYPSPLPVPAA